MVKEKEKLSEKDDFGNWILVYTTRLKILLYKLI
jgi:hypothetical protein